MCELLPNSEKFQFPTLSILVGHSLVKSLAALWILLPVVVGSPKGPQYAKRN